ncbi:MAG: 3-dehydroquinate synthase family protein [Actinomycetota bacterium]
MNAKPLAVVGLAGAGIAPVAAAIAARRGAPTADIDPLLDLGALRARLDERPPAIAVAPRLLAGGEARAELRRRATVVWLDGDDDALAARLAAGLDDPARGGEPEPADRRSRWLGPLTIAADVIVPVGRASVVTGLVDAIESAVDAIGDRPERRVERVELDGGRGYPIVVGRGVRHELAHHLPERAKRVAVITQPGVGVDIDTGRDQEVFLVPDGEEAKRLDVVGRLASSFAAWGLTRADCVVSIGGGVVSDLAGFVAASYHRGIPVIHVPTTLLGQIDAAIGGKCGVNLPEGKNLVGAFWQPDAVLCDVDTLDTLPPREFGAGMGELAKYHFLGGGQLDRLEVVERVARSVAIKAEVVSGDEREGGRRAILNYGHTLAHALETIAGHGAGSLGDRDGIRHGEAVAIGLIYAAEVAAALGRIDRDRVAEHRRVVAAYGLDGTLPVGLDHDHVIDLFARDKKAIDGVTFVLDGPSGVEPVPVDDRRLLAGALAAIEGEPNGRGAATTGRTPGSGVTA